MAFTRRSFVRKAAILSGGTFGLACFPLKVLGDCASEKRTPSLIDVDSNTKRANLGDWHLGDCELKNATITIRSDGSGTFDSQVCTHFTHSKDVWHLHLDIGPYVNAPGTLGTFQWDGPRMSERDNPLFHAWKVDFRIDAGSFKLMHNARVTSCC